MPVSGSAEAPRFGVYIHWPFCEAVCPYCDFVVTRARKVDEAAWVSAFRKALAHVREQVPDRRLASLFFGGGTPSLMSAKSIGTLIDHARSLWPCEEDLEISLEANPSDAERAHFQGLAAAGVTRLSLGVQAFEAAALKALGRWHGVDEALAAIAMAQEMFPSVSFDLIYGRPGQTCAEWQDELEQALSLDPDHLSLYQLTIEPGTAFERARARGRLVLPDEGEAARMFELCHERCAAAGLVPYEVSNFAKPGHQCTHNLIYWRMGDYAGIGPGAHGRLTIDGRRLATAEVRRPRDWLAQVQAEGHGRASLTFLDRRAQALELAVMGLRLSEGLDRRRLEALAGAVSPSRLAELEAQGLLKVTPHRLVATRRGRLVLDAVVRRLMN